MMGERPKQQQPPPPRRGHQHLWKKAVLHFSLCFVMGFFTGFAPSSSSSSSSTWVNPSHKHHGHLDANHHQPSLNLVPPPGDVGFLGEEDDVEEGNPRRLLIVVTTKRSGALWRRQAELLRLAHTLRLVRPPLLWVVVEAAGADAARTAETLRGTGVMYRHLAFRAEENFTSAAAEAHAQQNAALGHLEKHHLSGIVHFADATAVYDLRFFEEIRHIEAFGTWPVATMSAGKKKVVVEGPQCSSSTVVGWFSMDLGDGTSNTEIHLNPTDVSGFAFNSSILWDPERWGRPTSLPDTSQDSIKFVQGGVLEDRAKVKGIPSDCSQIMMWQY